MNDEFITALGAAVRALRGRLERELHAYGLHVGQQVILRTLWDEDGLTPGEIAERVGVEMPTVTRAVQRMERGGFLRRSADPDDARSVRVSLTARGRDLEAAISALLRGESERALRGLTPPQRRAATDLMRRIERNVRG